MNLAITAEDFEASTKGWIEAISAVLDLGIVKVGILVIASYGLIKTFRTQDSALKADVEAVKERQDRQGDRIDQVALAVPPVGAAAATGAPPKTTPIPAVQPDASHSEAVTEERT